MILEGVNWLFSARISKLRKLALTVGAADTVQLDPQQLSRAGIVVQPVLERSFGDRVRIVGQVVRSPGSTVTVKSIIGGRMETIEVSPGERVRAGQVLAEMHSHDLLGMQGQLLRTAESLRLAETRLEAGKGLFEVDGISAVDMELRRQEAFGYTGRLPEEAAPWKSRKRTFALIAWSP